MISDTEGLDPDSRNAGRTVIQNYLAQQDYVALATENFETLDVTELTTARQSADATAAASDTRIVWAQNTMLLIFAAAMERDMKYAIANRISQSAQGFNCAMFRCFNPPVNAARFGYGLSAGGSA